MAEFLPSAITNQRSGLDVLTRDPAGLFAVLRLQLQLCQVFALSSHRRRDGGDHTLLCRHTVFVANLTRGPMPPTLVLYLRVDRKLDHWLGRIVAYVRRPLAQNNSFLFYAVHSSWHRPNQHAVRKIGLLFLPVRITAHMQVLVKLLPEVVIARHQIVVRVLQLIAHSLGPDYAILQFVHVHFPLIVLVAQPALEHFDTVRCAIELSLQPLMILLF